MPTERIEHQGGQMEINTSEHDGRTVVELSGRLDNATAPDFEKKCTALVDAGARVIILDLGRLDYLSSAGLRGILAIAKRLQVVGGKLMACCLIGLVKEVFTVSGFDAMVPVASSVADALKSV
jgi:anti-sigma B factor antagonist